VFICFFKVKKAAHVYICICIIFRTAKKRAIVSRPHDIICKL